MDSPCKQGNRACTHCMGDTNRQHLALSAWATPDGQHSLRRQHKSGSTHWVGNTKRAALFARATPGQQHSLRKQHQTGSTLYMGDARRAALSPWAAQVGQHPLRGQHNTRRAALYVRITSITIPAALSAWATADG